MTHQIIKDDQGNEYLIPVLAAHDPEGPTWERHNGGQRPDHVYCNTVCDLFLRSGKIRTGQKAGNWIWWEMESPNDIMYYYVHNKDTSSKAHGDAVNHPSHYGGGDNVYEAIKVIDAWGLGFCLGNALKYISRAGKKDKAKEIQDLEKAAWYLNRHIENLRLEK